jgi:hypothetical protein
MKYLKTTLIAAVIIAGLIFIKFFNSDETDAFENIDIKDNTFINAIDQQIESIKNSDRKVFSKKLYEETIYSINEAKKNNKITPQWAKNLAQKAEFIYHDKFIQEAHFVFSKSEWSLADINYVRNEINRLSHSAYIESKTELNKLNKVLTEYSAIQSFLAKAKGYSVTNNVKSLSEGFDLQVSKVYIENAMKMSKTNSDVRNNKSLISQLGNVKTWMYQKHLDFLTKKYDYISGVDCKSFPDYSQYYNNVCMPMFNELNLFKNNANELYAVITEMWYNTIDKLSTDTSNLKKASQKICQ